MWPQDLRSADRCVPDLNLLQLAAIRVKIKVGAGGRSAKPRLLTQIKTNHKKIELNRRPPDPAPGAGYFYWPGSNKTKGRF